MKYRKLGRTPLSISEVGFGGWAIGGTGYGPTRDDDSHAALLKAYERGVNFFDTADTYGHGHSEELIGKFLKEISAGEIVIATKAGWDFYRGDGSRKNFEPDYLRFACDQSLKRLGLEAIDLYQLHNPSRELIQRGEVLETLSGLKKSGKIRFIGISIHRPEEGMAAIRDGRVDALQVVFSLLDQRMRDTLLVEAGKSHIGIIVREPLACGLLTGKYGPGHEFVKGDHRRRWSREKFELDLQKIERIKQVILSDRILLPQAALEYVLSFRAVSTVIPGAKTADQVIQNLRASEAPALGAQDISRLRAQWDQEEIFSKGLIPAS